jgi:hypothetical protein
MDHKRKPDFWTMPVNDLLDIIGWSKGVLAHKMGIGLRPTQRMCHGELPHNVREWLVVLAEHHWFHEYPKDW